MKTISAILLLTATVFAQTQTAHVVGTQSGLRPSGSWACFYELRIGNLTYVTVKSGRCDKSVATGMDLPYAIEGRYLRLTKPDGKELKTEIQGIHE